MEFKQTHVIEFNKKKADKKKHRKFLCKNAKEVKAPRNNLVYGKKSYDIKPKGKVIKGENEYFLGRALFNYKYR